MRPGRLALSLFTTLLASSLVAAESARAEGLLVGRSVDGRFVPDAGGAAGPIALASRHVTVSIDGPVASVTVDQRFENRTDRRLEADYLFPLPEGAALSGFAMTLGGRKVEGEVMDAAAARQVYESIVRRRRDPGLLEYLGRGLFRARVFPIEPRGAVEVRLSFQQVLPDDDGTLELRYPLAVRGADAATGEVVVDVTAKEPVPIRAVYSPSHPVAVVRRSETEVRATFESTGPSSRDFLLYVGRSHEDVGFSVVSEKPAGADGTFLAILAPSPKAPTEPVPKDVVFVLDTSGSMEDDGKIDQARRALSYGLGLLRPEDRFALVAFSIQPRTFRAALLPASPENRDAARAWLDGLRAEGGTDLAGGLVTALGMVDAKRMSMLVLLSDGRPTVGVTAPDAVVKAVRDADARHARVFTFGVGFDLDVQLLDRIAETTRGARDYVQPREELEIATSRFFRKVVDPVLTDVRVDLGEGAYDVYPTEIPDLFSGGEVVLMGRYHEAGPRRIVLRGRAGDLEVAHTYEVRFRADEKAPFLPRLWAQRKVAYLLDEIRLHGDEPELVQSVKELGVAYAIVTPYTANLVTDDAELGSSSARPTPPAHHGLGGPFRAPGGTVPPGLRRPSDPTPAPPSPPSAPSPAGPTTPTVPPPATTPASRPTDVSKRIRDAKERAREGEDANVRTAGGHTFVFRGGRWVDTNFDEKAKPIRVVAFSDAWTELLREDVRIAAILALGDRVDFVWRDQAYRVEPE